MAISDKLTTLNGIKSDIKAAIIAKGGTATDDFTTYATAITNLPSGGGGDDLKNLIERDITSIDIPAGTTKIGDSALYYCTGLTSVTIPNSVTSIGIRAFQSCTGLTSVTIPNSVTTIGNYAFGGTGLTNITIPNSVTSIDNYTFSSCTSLTSATIGNSVTSIGLSVFQSCTGLTSVTIGSSVTSIGTAAFSGCSGLTSVNIPNSVTTIGQNAFIGCTGLTSVTIGSSVTSIGNSAFQNCTSLTSITSLNTTPPTISSNSFTNVPATCAIYVPAASVDTYKAANIWSDRAAYIQAIPSGGGEEPSGEEPSIEDTYTVKFVNASDATDIVALQPSTTETSGDEYLYAELTPRTTYNVVVEKNGDALNCGDFEIIDDNGYISDCQFTTPKPGAFWYGWEPLTITIDGTSVWSNIVSSDPNYDS